MYCFANLRKADILEEKKMMEMFCLAMTGDNARPWLIAVCMIVSIIMVAALFLIGQKDKNKEDEE